MRTLFQKRCRNGIKITIGVRRFRKKAGNIINSNRCKGRETRRSEWRRYVWRGGSVIEEETGVKFVNLVRKEFRKRMRQ